MLSYIVFQKLHHAMHHISCNKKYLHSTNHSSFPLEQNRERVFENIVIWRMHRKGKKEEEDKEIDNEEENGGRETKVGVHNWHFSSKITVVT